MQYVVLLANKRDTSNRHWKTFKNLKEAKDYADIWCSGNEWSSFIHEIKGNY